jgi:hypothetical protein
VHWLTPRLGEFVELYPDINLTLITTDEDLARISHTTKCIGATNQRKLLCHNAFR